MQNLVQRCNLINMSQVYAKTKSMSIDTAIIEHKHYRKTTWEPLLCYSVPSFPPNPESHESNTCHY